MIVYLSYHLEYGVMIPLQVEHEQLALRFVQDCWTQTLLKSQWFGAVDRWETTRFGVIESNCQGLDRPVLRLHINRLQFGHWLADYLPHYSRGLSRLSLRILPILHLTQLRWNVSLQYSSHLVGFGGVGCEVVYLRILGGRVECQCLVFVAFGCVQLPCRFQREDFSLGLLPGFEFSAQKTAAPRKS